MDNWKEKTAYFLGGQAISLFGSSLVQFALVWHVTMGTQSGSMMTIATVVGFVPMVLLTPFGGMWADRLNRRYLIAGADALVALSTLVLLVSWLAGYQELWTIFAAMAVRAFGQGVQSPAVGALLPQIVPAEFLGKVNGYNASIQASVNLVAPLVAGAVLSVASIPWVLSIDLVTAAIGISLLLLLVKVPAHAGVGAEHTQSGLKDIADGIRYVHRHPFLRRVLGFSAVLNLVVTPVALLTPLQVTRTFANDVRYLTAIELAFALGMLLGGIAIGVWGGFRSKVTTMGVAITLLGLLTVALGLPVNFLLYNTWMFLAGVVLPMVNTPAMTLVQLGSEEAFMGRVFSVITMIGVAAMPLGMLGFGPLADVVSVESILVVTGAFMATLGVWVTLDRSLHVYEPVPSAPAPAVEPGATPPDAAATS